MKRYAHEEYEFDSRKRPVKRMSEKQVLDRIKYRERRQSRENESRNERETLYPEPEDDCYYRP